MIAVVTERMTTDDPPNAPQDHPRLLPPVRWRASQRGSTLFCLGMSLAFLSLRDKSKPAGRRARQDPVPSEIRY